jgi:hypothetical protein
MVFHEPRIVVKNICYKQLYLKERDISNNKSILIDSLKHNIKTLHKDATVNENNLSKVQFVVCNMFMKNHEISKTYKRKWGTIFVSMIDT